MKKPKPEAAASDAAESDTEGRSGTAREAPSTDRGTPAEAPSVGVQPAAPSDPEPPAAVGARHPAFTVRASQPRRMRAGRAFGPEPVTIAADTLSDAEIEAIASDPVLSIGAADAT